MLGTTATKDSTPIKQSTYIRNHGYQLLETSWLETPNTLY